MLPPELFDSIVEHVDQPSDLLSFSTISKSFVFPCQRRLFRHFKIAFNPSARQATVADQTLSRLRAYPHLLGHIREATIDIPRSLDVQATLASILELFVANCIVERLALHGQGQRWDALRPSLRTALSSIISTPPLRKLHLLRLRAPPGDLMWKIAESVHVLSLNHVVGPQSSFNDRFKLLSRDTLQLRHFIVPTNLASSSIFRDWAFLFDSPRLMHISVPLVVFGSIQSANSRHSLFSRLQSLVIETGASLEPIDLPTLPALTDLTLVFIRHSNSTIPHAITQLLETIAAPHLARWTLHLLLPATEHLGYYLAGGRTWGPASGIRARCRENSPNPDVHCILTYTDPHAGASASAYFEFCWGEFVPYMRDALRDVACDSNMGRVDVGRLSFARAEEQSRSRERYLDYLP